MPEHIGHVRARSREALELTDLHKMLPRSVLVETSQVRTRCINSQLVLAIIVYIRGSFNSYLVFQNIFAFCIWQVDRDLLLDWDVDRHR